MECLVCQVPNSGTHFGVNCCRACAAFFRRTIQLQLRYDCRFVNQCDVTHKNRYSCRACRAAKCYALGMESHENCKKEFIKQKEVYEQQVPDEGPSSSEQSWGNSCGTPPKTEKTDITDILKFRLNQIFRTPSIHQSTSQIPLCQQALLAYQHHSSLWPNCTPEKIVHTVVIDLNAFMQAHYLEIEHIANFCMSISYFSTLSIDEKWLLFRRFWPRFIELDRTYVTSILLGNRRDDGRVVNYDGKVVNFTCYRSGMIGDLPEMSNMTEAQIKNLLEGSVIHTKKLFSDPFKLYQPDIFEIIYMMMTMMWNLKEVDGISQETVDLSKMIQENLSEELHVYYFDKKNYASRLYKIHHLLQGLDKVSKIRKEDGYMSRTFNVFKQDIFLNDLK